MSNTKFLVTGGAGFIGSNIVEELLRQGYWVRVLDNFSTGKRENLKEIIKDIELIEGDIRSYHTVQKAVKGIEIILHQAALPSVPRSIADPITTNEVNVGGTLNILDAAKEFEVKRIVFASSSSIYGNNAELPKHEGMSPNPLSPYAVSKLTGEYYLKVFHKLYGLETIALRYFNVFGPKQDPHSQYAAVIPKFIKAIRENRAPIIYGDGSQSRDFTYITNIVQANILSAFINLDHSLIMNCACQQQITLIELVHRINQLLSKEIQPIFAPERIGDVKHSLAKIELLRSSLNWSPPICFNKGIEKLVLSNT